MSELYHAKRSHKYVAKVKGAGKGGRPLYFYTMTAYRSFMNGVKEKTGLAAKEERDKYRKLAEQNAATYDVNRSLNSKAQAEMKKSSALNKFHTTREATAKEAVETHTQGMKAVMKMTNSRTNGKGTMNGREAGEFARQHIKATTASRAEKAHSQGRDEAIARYKASSAWKDATKERADNAYNKTILAQRRAHQAQQAYEKTLPGRLEKKARDISSLPSKWGHNAKVGLESARRTVVGDKRDKYAAWKLNKTAQNTTDKQLANAYSDKAAKLKTRYDGSLTGIGDRIATSIRHVFKKSATSNRSVKSLGVPSEASMGLTRSVVARSGGTKVNDGSFRDAVGRLKQIVGYEDYKTFKTASKSRRLAENRYRNQQNQYKQVKDYYDAGVNEDKFKSSFGRRRVRQDLDNEKRWTRSAGAEVRRAKNAENEAKDRYSKTLMGSIDNFFGGIKTDATGKTTNSGRYHIKRNAASELTGQLRKKNNVGDIPKPANTEKADALSKKYPGRKKRVTENNGEGVKKRGPVKSLYIDPASGKGVPTYTIEQWAKEGRISKEQALSYLDSQERAGNITGGELMAATWHINNPNSDPLVVGRRIRNAKKARAKKRAAKRGEHTK